jgi:hypothetical protein
MSTNTNKGLVYTATKKIGKDKEINVKIRLDDDCNNKVCDFAITAEIYEIAKNGKRVWVAGGCLHEEILKHFPQFAPFVRLHLSNLYGQPMYAVENGIFWLKESTEKGAEYLRIPLALAKMLVIDKGYFKYQLFSLGIVDKWKEEADAAIAQLEELCGKKFVNPYTPEEERFVLRLGEEEREKMRGLESLGYFTQAEVAKRKKAADKQARQEKRRSIAARYDKDIAKARQEKKVMLAVFDCLGSVENVILYTHYERPRLSFNAFAYHQRQWTDAEIDKVCALPALHKLSPLDIYNDKTLRVQL